MTSGSGWDRPSRTRGKLIAWILEGRQADPMLTAPPRTPGSRTGHSYGAGYN